MTNRHAARGLVAVPLLTAALTGCAVGDVLDGSDEPVAVTLEASDWNGWDEDHEPSVETVRVDTVEGDTATIDGLTVTFTSVAPDEVEVRTSQDMAPRTEEGGLSLLDLERDFTATTGAPALFSTASTDSGTHYTVTIDG